MNKTQKIDLSPDRLIGVAADLTDEHNYISALKMLNKNADLSGNDEDSYMLYAEIFDDLGLYEKSVNNWFRFLDVVHYNELSDCYEGLAVCYMNLGIRHFSAYYYNKLLMETEEMDGEMREQIVSDFLSEDENPLKFVWPPKLADCSEIISKGIDHMKANEYDEAVAEFEKVEAENKSFSTARNYIAMCKIIGDKPDEAEAECRRILDKNPDDVQALTTLAAVMTETDKRDEARALAEKLLTLELKSDDEKYKIATVCCENKMHAEAYNLFCSLSAEMDYDLTVNYFKAISAFNCGKFSESFDTFDKILTIYPDAVTVKYWYDAARQMYDEGKAGELSYFYRLPYEIRESSLKFLAAYLRLSEKQAKILDEEVDVTDCVLWAFDDGETGGTIELKRLAARVAVKARMDGFVRDLLLDAFLPDELKIEALTALAERNEENGFGVVVCHIYKFIPMSRVRVERLKRKYFVAAYARLTAHFGILDEEHSFKFAEAAKNLYFEMKERGNLDASKDVDALSAAIYMRSGISETGVVRDNVCSFFDIDQKRLSKITGE